MKYTILFATSALFAATIVHAAPHGGSAFIRDYDTNKDGQVTRAEFDTVRNARFAATDADKNGWVSDSEYLNEFMARLETQLATSDRSAEKKTEERQRQTRQTHVRFGALDKDNNKQMTKAEYDASGNFAFVNHDDDKNGTVTLADTQATAAKRAAAAAAAGQKTASTQ